MIKKKYIQPMTEVLLFTCKSNILVGSAITGGGDDDYVEGDGDSQLSNRDRDEWSDIWSYM